MELAKITSKGQITLPIEIRRKLNLKEGGKVAFIESDGGYTIVNPVLLAIKDLRKAFEGEAERLGLKTEDDVVAMVKEVRKEMWDEQNENRG
ncbi:MAG: AbrB/MazE/SpoVT family DNA-binding domain-containing protein [Fusobacteriaceae bacterium]|jgi:AbrB family looped-hinge helix DNA binding protein|nr:AbrB/MazE/SpoVT family DNA-binding domain-containing protein [Fusobacteriaceae bacterium]